MSITDRTRKILWGRSGNRCALCRHELVVDATPSDDESVVGEECHIISGKVSGPRHDPTFPIERIDEIENLILLCRVHHKMVDDQFETYSVEMLRMLKLKHEEWVSVRLKDDQPMSVRVRRIKENIPHILVRLTSGRDVIQIAQGAMASSMEHDEPLSEDEVDMVSSFLQEVEDWCDIASDVEIGERVRMASRISGLLAELEQAGFWVFGGREVQQLEGGDSPPSPFPVSILRVVRSTNPEINRDFEL